MFSFLIPPTDAANIPQAGYVINVAKLAGLEIPEINV
jgi:hypothetical protein